MTRRCPSRVREARDGITPELVFQTEGALAQLGIEMSRTGKYLDAMGPPALPGLSWSWLHDILHTDPRELAPEADHLAQHMQAVAAQLQFMRGPYVPQEV